MGIELTTYSLGGWEAVFARPLTMVDLRLSTIPIPGPPDLSHARLACSSASIWRRNRGSFSRRYRTAVACFDLRAVTPRTAGFALSRFALFFAGL